MKGHNHNVQKTKGSPNLEYSSTFSYSLHSKHCMFHYLQESTEAVKVENRKGKKSNIKGTHRGQHRHMSSFFSVFKGHQITNSDWTHTLTKKKSWPQKSPTADYFA